MAPLPVADLSSHHRQTGVRELHRCRWRGVSSSSPYSHIHPGVDEGNGCRFHLQIYKNRFHPLHLKLWYSKDSAALATNTETIL